MAEEIGCSHKTVKRYLKLYHISLRDKYSKISDDELKSKINELLHPDVEIGKH
jgi:hypothetical protein